MKYKLINKQTGEGHLCDKVTIDKFDYYVGNIPAASGDFALYAGHITKKLIDTEWTTGDKKVIATNNPNIDAPRVVDEVMELAKEQHYDGTLEGGYLAGGFYNGYNKSQETHPFSEEDMIEFAKWSNRKEDKSKKELLQLWKEQQPKVIYYNTIKQ